MVRLSVMYPQEQGKKFDLGYYMKDHSALLQSRWGSLIKGADFTRGLSGGAPDAPPTYHVMAHITFGSMDDLKQALAQGGELFADIPNFTDIRPVVQVSEVLG